MLPRRWGEWKTQIALEYKSEVICALRVLPKGSLQAWDWDIRAPSHKQDKLLSKISFVC